MPVIIKNSLNNEVKIISLKESKDRIKYPPNIWKVVARKDIVEVMEPNILMNSGFINHGEFEKEDLEQVLTTHPQATYQLLPNWGNWDKVKISKIKDDNQSLDEFLRPNDFVRNDRHKKIKAIIKHITAIPLKKPTFSDWVAIFTILGAIATILGVIIQIKSSNSNIQILNHTKE